MGDARVVVRRVLAAVLVVGLVALAILVRRSGMEAAQVQRQLVALGWVAAPVFLVAFAVGELLHLPGILFVVAARVVFGLGAGLALGYAGALLAVTLSFLVARFVVSAARAQKEPWRPKWRFLRRAFERLESAPVRTIALLRVVLWLAPPLTYALAATKVRSRDHFVGSALGLVLPVAAAALLAGYL